MSLLPPTFATLAVFKQYHPKFVDSVLSVLEYGASKYDLYNWTKGGSWCAVLDSALRHTEALRNGEIVDAESGLDHAGHLACNVVFLIEFYANGIGEDDRPEALNQIFVDFDEDPQTAANNLALKLYQWLSAKTRPDKGMFYLIDILDILDAEYSHEA